MYNKELLSIYAAIIKGSASITGSFIYKDIDESDGAIERKIIG